MTHSGGVWNVRILSLIHILFAASFLVKGQVQPLPETTSSGTTPAISHESAWETVNVKAGGDVMLARKVGRYMDAQGIDYPIQYVKDWLADADITIDVYKRQPCNL